jgi:precorrin-2 dehydrogenase/sirohydrochlorin ferrochelatase
VYYPAQLEVRGLPVLIVGGGEVAVRKAGSLLEAGAQLTVVSPQFHAGFRELARGTAKRNLKLLKRKYRIGDLKGQRLVFAATDVEPLNSKIAIAAKARGQWVNVAAPPDAGDFLVPSHFRRGPVMVSISTGGASASLARAMRERLEKALGEEWGLVAELLEQRRKSVHARVSDPVVRRALLLKLGSAKLVALAKKSGRATVAREMDRLIDLAAEKKSTPTRRVRA